MIVDAGELKGNANVGAELRKLTTHVLLDLMQTIHLLFVGREVFLVDFVDENLVSDTRFELMGGNDQITEANTSILVVLGLRVNHVNEGTTVTD